MKGVTKDDLDKMERSRNFQEKGKRWGEGEGGGKKKRNQ